MRNKKFSKRKKNNESTNWSNADENILLKYLSGGEKYHIKEVQLLFPERSDTSLKNKVRRLRIKHDLFGEEYREEKRAFTYKWAKKIKPRVVFDAYAGAGHQSVQWLKYTETLFASDKQKIKPKQFSDTVESAGFKLIKTNERWFEFLDDNQRNLYFYRGDILQAAIDIAATSVDIDVLDLDTCGSTLPILPALLGILKPRYLMITHGEFHSFRFKREDVLRRVLFARDISAPTNDMTLEDLVYELDRTVKLAALRSHNETRDSLWAELLDQTWLGNKPQGMLRRVYKLAKPKSTAQCLNSLLGT